MWRGGNEGRGREAQIPCRWCATPITIDRAEAIWHDGRPFQVCPGCAVEVPLRHSDGFTPLTEREQPPDNVRRLFGRALT